jgi:lysophospholipase L1-like esterase
MSETPESGPPDLPGVPRGDAPGAEPPIPKAPRGRRGRARDALVVVFLSVVVLGLFEGSSIRQAGDDMQPGFERDVLRAVGEPAGWIADRLPFDEWGDDALAFLEDEGVGEEGGFDEGRRADAAEVPPVSPDSFDPAELGAKPDPPRELDKLVVTGDSLSMPLDVEIARRLAEQGEVDVERDPHVGTGISKTGLLDWGKLSTEHVAEREPDAVVVFIGANEGFPMPGPDGEELDCCAPAWAAEYAYRARRMMNTYRQRGEARVYWLTLPAPRDRDLREVARSVNAAIRVAAEPYRAHVRVLDMHELFTPDGSYRDAMTVDGRRQIVREADGIHLNPRGAELAADVVLEAVRRDFGG